ncbi:hypothetical protein ANCDUO_09507 [Ancylostoma duodenale]|uniref:Uncharacterized protein n=1 Tax=Ancylostoma duodenale TaxID=51022 RepID=A0A0C2CTM8_9BILA|nr:hypothetical protein ANCDUO_09507 [Ancylostoma duodenale]
MEAEFRDSREKLLRDLRELQNQQSEQKSRLEQITKTDLDRSLMIRRIMEMTGSIQKQDQEIRKETDDPKGERAYKLFGKLHSTCMISVEAIEQNGALSRQNEELVDLIEIEKQEHFDEQLNRIQMDLDVIEKENARLEQMLTQNHS